MCELVGIYLCMWMYMYACMYTCVHVRVEAKGHPRVLFFQPHLPYYYFFLRQCLSLDLDLPE